MAARSREELNAPRIECRNLDFFYGATQALKGINLKVPDRQVTGMISGLSDAARYEFANNSRPGMARAYWDAFGAGLGLAVLAIILGSAWSLISGMRARRTAAEGE